MKIEVKENVVMITASEVLVTEAFNKKDSKVGTVRLSGASIRITEELPQTGEHFIQLHPFNIWMVVNVIKEGDSADIHTDKSA